MNQHAPDLEEATAQLNRSFITSLRALKQAGQADRSCRIAAEAWSRLRHIAPGEAERINAVMHFLAKTDEKDNHSGIHS